MITPHSLLTHPHWLAGCQGVKQLCQMLRSSGMLSTLRVDVASREGAEAIARELPGNRSLTHLTLGGPVPEPLLAKMSEILAANTMSRNSDLPGERSCIARGLRLCSVACGLLSRHRACGYGLWSS